MSFTHTSFLPAWRRRTATAGRLLLVICMAVTGMAAGVPATSHASVHAPDSTQAAPATMPGHAHHAHAADHQEPATGAETGCQPELHCAASCASPVSGLAPLKLATQAVTSAAGEVPGTERTWVSRIPERLLRPPISRPTI